jgi:hypothetical protein
MIDPPLRYRVIDTVTDVVYGEYFSLYAAEMRCTELDRFKTRPFPVFCIVEIEDENDE